MKVVRKVLLFICILFSLSVFAQKGLSVAGVSLGDEYSRVKSVLDERFGRNYDSKKSDLDYYDVFIGDISYVRAHFKFKYNRVTSDWRLNHVFLYQRFELSELRKAKEYRDYIASVYKQKYDLKEDIDEDGFKWWYTDEENLCIWLDKGKAKNGKTYYWIHVQYGPYYNDSLDDI